MYRSRSAVQMSVLLRRFAVSCAATAAMLGCALAVSPAASASSRQIAIIQDTTFLNSPVTALPQARALGARTIRAFVSWYLIAPHPASIHRPRFNASDPNGYPAADWAPYDQMVRLAARERVTLDLELTGGAPRWAEGRNAPRQYRANRSSGWWPSAKLYGQFVHAVTERYDGHFTPPGSRQPLPAVHFWSFWNEPNFGQSLGPQSLQGSTKPVSPRLYRALLDAGWRALRRSQPKVRNTVLIGEIAATGYALHTPGDPGRLPGVGSNLRALVFVRALYCVDAHFKALRGATAVRFGCPPSRAGSRRFRARNPALFEATGFADHPYASKRPPDANPAQINRDFATFPVLHRVARALDRVTGAYGSHKRYPVYNDEYGYITSPPDPKSGPYPSQSKAAIYLNEAEYLSYKNPRVASYAQYLLDDPPRNKTHQGPGFASGLYSSTGRPKATMYAYRMPVWLPRQTIHGGARAEIWGGARPAALTGPATVEIQMSKAGAHPWTTVATARTAAGTGYFDIRHALPFSGRLRLSYTYPETESFLPPSVAGTTIHSRTVRITVTG